MIINPHSKKVKHSTKLKLREKKQRELMAKESSLSFFLGFLLSLFLLHLVVAVDGGRDLGSTQHQHHNDHMMMMSPGSKVLFRLKELKQGSEMEVYFPNRDDPSKSPHFLAREEADSIPFSSKYLPYLLKLFSYKPGTTEASTVAEALSTCENEPIEGETKFCATSLESMLDFAQDTLGPQHQIKVLSTTHLIRTDGAQPVQNYTIVGEPEEVEATRQVACHTLGYPYAIFYCHSQVTENKNLVFMVSLASDNGDKVDALAMCHLDTSHWPKGHIAFKVLGVKPGETEVCHFFPEDHLLYVPIHNHSESSAAS